MENMYVDLYGVMRKLNLKVINDDTVDEYVADVEYLAVDKDPFDSQLYITVSKLKQVRSEQKVWKIPLSTPTRIEE